MDEGFAEIAEHLDALIERLMSETVALNVPTALALEGVASLVSAEKFRQTTHQKRQQETRRERNKKYTKRPHNITQQPRRKGKAYVGRCTFVWVDGPNKGQKCNQMITLDRPAQMRIQGKELIITPNDGEPYAWGEPKEEGKKNQKHKRKQEGPPPDDRFESLRMMLQAKLDDLIARKGAKRAGREMARFFVYAYNKLLRKRAKRALTKIYRVVMQTNEEAWASFQKRIKEEYARG